MIFGEHAMTIQWGKDSFFQQMVLGKLDVHVQKNEIEPIPYTYKNQLKMDQCPKQ